MWLKRETDLRQYPIGQVSPPFSLPIKGEDGQTVRTQLEQSSLGARNIEHRDCPCSPRRPPRTDSCPRRGLGTDHSHTDGPPPAPGDHTTRWDPRRGPPGINSGGLWSVKRRNPLSREPDRRPFLNRGPGDTFERALGLELNPRLEDGITDLRFLLNVTLRGINFVGVDNRLGDRRTPKRPPRVPSFPETKLGPGEPPPGTEPDSADPITAPVGPHVSTACDIPP
ncbi:unnamed protein product [Merluccius merluccius]